MEVLGVEVPEATKETQRVLDVPPLDMTDSATSGPSAAAAPSADTEVTRATPRARRASSKPRRKSATAKKTSPKPSTKESARPARGSVGKETYEAVERLVSGGTKKMAAFEQVASESGRSPGTVAATYYRVARQQGAPARRASDTSRRTRTEGKSASAARRQTRQASRSQAPAPASDLNRIAEQIVTTLSALTAAVSAQSRELAELRSRVDGIRQVIR